MTTNPLDAIQARHDRVTAEIAARCSCCQPSQAHKDRGKLVAALRLIEQYCTIAETDVNGNQREPLPIHPNVIRGAIREALG